MSLIQLPSMISAVPEIFLACAGMILLMIGVFRKTDGTGVLSMATILCFIVAIICRISVWRPRECVLRNVHHH